MTEKNRNEANEFLKSKGILLTNNINLYSLNTGDSYRVVDLLDEYRQLEKNKEKLEPMAMIPMGILTNFLNRLVRLGIIKDGWKYFPSDEVLKVEFVDKEECMEKPEMDLRESNFSLNPRRFYLLQFRHKPYASQGEGEIKAITTTKNPEEWIKGVAGVERENKIAGYTELLGWTELTEDEFNELSRIQG